MQEIEKNLMYKFKRKELLIRAFTHRSCSSLKESYERLEFIGDRVIGLVVADILLDKFPMAEEGELARRHTAIVRAETLAQIAISCDFGKYIKVSDNKDKMQSNVKILSDVVEACIGALFRDGGLEAVNPFVKKHILPLLETNEDDLKDYKTRLQEWAQKNKYGLPVYEAIKISGNDHTPEFTINVKIKGFEPVSGKGKSKKEASQKSAYNFMKGNKII